MTSSDASRFAAALGLLAEALAEPLSETRVAAYFEALKDLDIEAVETAVRRLLRTTRFFPKPVEFFEALGGAPEDQAEKAWLRLLDGIRGVGGWESVTFTDPVLHRVVLDLWADWPAACRLESEEVPFRRQDFVRLYRLRQRQGPDAGAPAHLPGLIEQGNAARGLREWIPAPVVVPNGLTAPGMAPISAPPARILELTQRAKS